MYREGLENLARQPVEYRQFKRKQVSPIMNQAISKTKAEQQHEEASRSLLDQLLADSRVYKTGQSYKDLLEFATRLRNAAPFNCTTHPVNVGIRRSGCRADVNGTGQCGIGVQ